jgi:hypothetical protein
MINVFQIILDNEKVNKLNAGGSWFAVEWGKTYLDLTSGKFQDSSNVSAMEMILEAIEFGLVKHTKTIDTNDMNEAYEIGNYMGDVSKMSTVAKGKSVSIGDILINPKTLLGNVVVDFGFEQLTVAEVKEIETLVPQKMMVGDVQ